LLQTGSLRQKNIHAARRHSIDDRFGSTVFEPKILAPMAREPCFAEFFTSQAGWQKRGYGRAGAIRCQCSAQPCE
jgi:hypothetical protein